MTGLVKGRAWYARHKHPWDATNAWMVVHFFVHGWLTKWVAR